MVLRPTITAESRCGRWEEVAADEPVAPPPMLFREATGGRKAPRAPPPKRPIDELRQELDELRKRHGTSHDIISKVGGHKT